VTTANNLKANLASPTFTGTPTAPTQTAGNSSTQLATTAFVTTANNLKANLASPTFTGTPTAPTQTAGNSSTQLATTAFVTTANNLKANLASPTFTGTPTAPTQTAGNNTTRLATTAFVTTANNLKANLASPTFTGTVNATTVDTTNLEVTNIKAKDGTASATIANSTGVLTVASSVLTTADINGGSIDGTVIGGSTPAAIGGTTGTFSGDVSIADKIVHTGDTNTAIRFPAADTVAIETNGAERLRVTSAGNVGIGTSSPFGELTLGASGPASLYLEDGASSSTSNRYIVFYNDNGLRVKTRTDADTFVSNDYLITTDASGATAHRWQTANTEKMRLTTNGLLGIGTTDPQSEFHVIGAGVFSRGLSVGVNGVDDTCYITFERGSVDGIIGPLTTRMLIGTQSAHDVAFITNNDEKMRLSNAGNLLIGTTSTGASKLRVVGLPTSSAGLSAGDIWNDGGTLKIV
jgi:hypothetical protein